MSRTAHVETLIEFEMEPPPVAAAPRVPGPWAARLRRAVGAVGVTIGAVLAVSVATGIGASPGAPPSVVSTAAPVPPACRLVASSGPGHMVCVWTVPGSPSAEVAARRAREAQAAAAAAAAHPETGGYRTRSSSEPPAGVQRLGSP
ncbi:hypothetical protein [Cellulomonas sp. P5_C6]